MMEIIIGKHDIITNKNATSITYIGDKGVFVGKIFWLTFSNFLDRGPFLGNFWLGDGFVDKGVSLDCFQHLGNPNEESHLN